MNWKDYWEESAVRFDENAFCEQVGRTVAGGQPVAAEQLERVVEDVAARLDLRPHHTLLDLCCGNGLLTLRLAQRVRWCVGVDFSAGMIALASRHHAAEGLDYHLGSVTELRGPLLESRAPFDRACLIESLHYFGPEALEACLDRLIVLGADDLRIYLPGVLDRERQDRFYDTPERRAAHERAVAEDRDPMGRWWEAEEIAALAAARGLSFERLEQDPELSTAHYRFDVLLGREAGA